MLIQRIASASTSSSSSRVTAVIRRSVQQQQQLQHHRFVVPSSVLSSSSFFRLASTTTTTSVPERLLYDKIPKQEFGPYQEYSVIHTNRSLNIMSPPFGTVMRDLNHLLQTTYQCASVALIPGSGTYGMEAVGRQFATDEHVLILRNGWFRYVLLVHIYYSSWNKIRNRSSIRTIIKVQLWCFRYSKINQICSTSTTILF